jgi:sugar phosphate isomerase/epimerase
VLSVGLAALTLGRPDPLVLVAAAADAGFRAVGLTPWAPGAPLSPECTDRVRRRRLAAELAATGTAVSDAGVVVLSPRLAPSTTARLLDTAAGLGAPRVLVADAHEDRHRAAGQLAAVAAAAADLGLRVALEFMPYGATRTLDEATALLAAAGAGNAGLVVDVLHLYRSGGSAASLAGLDPALVELVQLCDAPLAAPPPGRLRSEALTDRRYPGDGELPLRAVLAALPAGAPVTVEAPVARDAARSPGPRAAAAAAAVRRLLDPAWTERSNGLSICATLLR